MLALFPPLLITNPAHPTLQALHSASLRLRSLPNSTRPSRPAQPPANAVPSTALHLLTSSRPAVQQTNRSTAPANRSIRFTSLRFHSAPSVSAVKRKKEPAQASHSATLRLRNPEDLLDIIETNGRKIAEALAVLRIQRELLQ